MSDIVFIDPQSYNNLSLYDKGVLSELPQGMATFIGSTLWNCEPLDNAEMKLWFRYNSCKNPVSKLLSYLMTLLKIARLVKKQKPKIVHIQWTRVMALDKIFAKYLQSKGIKVVHTAHNILPHNSGDKYKTQFGEYYRLVDHIVVHSEMTKKEMIELFDLPSEKISVIPHGIIDIEADYTKMASRVEELRNQYGLKGKLIFASIGAQSQYKGVDTIIDVWTSNPKFANNPHCHLMLIGKNEGVDVSRLHGLSNVTIVDERLSNLDFISFLKLSDVVLLPYRKISQSGVLFSALANDVPVIVSEVGGLTEPLKIANVGWNIGEPTKDNLEREMSQLLDNPDEIEKVKSNKQEFQKIQNFYNWPRISEMTFRLYSEMTNFNK